MTVGGGSFSKAANSVKEEEEVRGGCRRDLLVKRNKKKSGDKDVSSPADRRAEIS